MTVMSAAMDLAEGSGTDLGSATSALAATMQAFGEKASQSANVSDVLFNGVPRDRDKVFDSLSSALDKAKTKLGGMAPPLDQMAGLLVDMADHGETGKAALSALTTSFAAFLKPAGDVAKAQADLNAATKALPPSLQALAAQVTSGATSQQAATKATSGLSQAQKDLWTQFTSASTAAAAAGEAQTKIGRQRRGCEGQDAAAVQYHRPAPDPDQGHGHRPGHRPADGGWLLEPASAKLVGVIQAGPAAFDKATAAASRSGSAHDARPSSPRRSSTRRRRSRRRSTTSGPSSASG